MYYITDKMNDKLRKTSELVADLINTTQEIPKDILEKHIELYEDKIYELEQKKEKLTLARDILQVIYDKKDKEIKKEIERATEIIQSRI